MTGKGYCEAFQGWKSASHVHRPHGASQNATVFHGVSWAKILVLQLRQNRWLTKTIA